MFVDASAILAILLNEAEGQALATALNGAERGSRITSAIAAWEAAAGLYRRKNIPMPEAEAQVRQFLKTALVDIVSIDERELSGALQAFDRYGRHRLTEAERNKALNIADCFHYACAKSHRVAMLHKDEGFKRTDIRSAVGPR